MEKTAEGALLEWVDNATRRSMYATLRFSQTNNISLAMIKILSRTSHKNCLTINELANLLGVSMPAASQTVSKMVEQGWVSRQESPTDRRERIISMTEKGNDIVYRSRIAHHAWIHEFMLQFSDEEKQVVIAALELLNRKMETFDTEMDNQFNEGKEN